MWDWETEGGDGYMEISAPTLVLMRPTFEFQEFLKLSKPATDGTEVSFFCFYFVFYNVDNQGDIEIAFFR